MLARAKGLFVAIALVIGLFMLVDRAVEYLWLEALGYESVFWTIRPLQVGLFVSAFVLVLLYLWINIRILSLRVAIGAVTRALTQQIARRSGAVDSDAGTPILLILVAIVIALVFGFVLGGSWDTLLRFHWSQAYGQVDPIYDRDFGFYLFELPFLELLQNSLVAVTFVASALLLLAYVYGGAFRVGWRQGVEAPPNVLRHVAANLALYLVGLAWGFYLGRFALLQSTTGVVYGAGYTDVYVVRPALWILVGATLGLAVAALFPSLFIAGRKALITVGGYLVILLSCLAIVPWGVQSLVVEPSELELEEPFLRYNIRFTRKAFSLDQIDERSYAAVDGLTLASLAANQQTIDNIRLWDWRPLSQTFRQLQQIRLYYEFSDVGVDRYWVGGSYRQVMLAARELSEDLPGRAKTWVNRRLQYTHGYGLAMSLTATMSEQGFPVLIVKDLPPRTEGGLSVAQPGIYYGETMSGYRIVATSVKELDYPKGDENVYTHYLGHGGMRLDSFWKKLLFAWHQFDVNLLLTSYVTPESRIQLWRDIRDRVRRIAPFLLLDEDPYLVVADGRLYWIQDAYATSSTFPYSEPHAGQFNYIRNSVKVIVDAYNGDVAFYVIDADDPVLGVYREALPALFRALDEMPDALRRHLRYPQDLFEAQVAQYNTYHVTVPQVFYNGEDVWTTPWEKYGGEQIRLEPYYVLMQLPEERRLQFLLMTPLTPSNRDNMIAWMAARSDLPGYGDVIVYKLPKERLIFGPIQIEAMIDQDTVISQQLSLWDQRGSRVIRGNLIVIPIEQSFIYVEPVYLVSEGTNIPQLKRVIVSNGERLAMEPTLERALEVVFGERRRGPAEGVPVEETNDLAEAREALGAAKEAFRDGDWDAFGRAMQNLDRLLGE